MNNYSHNHSHNHSHKHSLLNQTPPPPVYIQKSKKNKQSYKKVKDKIIYTTPIINVNSKNQKKKKAKQLARQLFKLSKKIGNLL